jgi:hypothetical protein
LTKAGIPSHFTAYSYKHAAISYLVKFNIPQQQIKQACRFKFYKQDSKIFAYYAISKSLKLIHKLLSSATSQNRTLEGLIENSKEIEPIVIGRVPMIEKENNNILKKKGKKERKETIR